MSLLISNLLPESMLPEPRCLRWLPRRQLERGVPCSSHCSISHFCSGRRTCACVRVCVCVVWITDGVYCQGGSGWEAQGVFSQPEASPGCVQLGAAGFERRDSTCGSCGWTQLPGGSVIGTGDPRGLALHTCSMPPRWGEGRARPRGRHPTRGCGGVPAAPAPRLRPVVAATQRRL